MSDSVVYCVIFFFFKQKTAYEMRISDWSSDVCSSDLPVIRRFERRPFGQVGAFDPHVDDLGAIFQRLAIERDLDIVHHRAALGRQQGGESPLAKLVAQRSEERRVGKECVSTCRSRWSPYH